MDTWMETVERNIGNLDNSANYMAHKLAKCMRKFKQSSKIAPPGYQGIGVDTAISMTINDNTKITEASNLSCQ